jgi:hypothetical protein
VSAESSFQRLEDECCVESLTQREQNEDGPYDEKGKSFSVLTGISSVAPDIFIWYNTTGTANTLRQLGRFAAIVAVVLQPPVSEAALAFCRNSG